jgi:hypothetical protein
MRHPGKGYAALRDLCSASIARAPRHLGGAEFALFGCVARAVLRPGAGIYEGAGGNLIREVISGSEPLLGMHVRFGSIHTSNYQVSIHESGIRFDFDLGRFTRVTTRVGVDKFHFQGLRVEVPLYPTCNVQGKLWGTTMIPSLSLALVSQLDTCAGD